MSNPSAYEQLSLEYVNLFRTDPAGEYARIIGQQPNIQSAIDYFGVDLTALTTQLAAIDPIAPLAWNTHLSQSAETHSQLMIDFDQQSHGLPGEPGIGARISNAGYTSWSGVGENIFAYSDDALYGHAGFIIDWGYDDADYDSSGNLLSNWQSLGDGIQDPAGHRVALMNPGYTEIGIGVIQETNSQTRVGEFVTTQHLGSRFNYTPQFLGVVVDDRDGDMFYDIGEGLGGVTVTLSGDGGVYTTESWDSGGWQIAVAPGSYTITFSGGGLGTTITRTAVLGSENVKVDAYTSAPAVPGQTLYGDGGRNTLTGGMGDDTLYGLGGNDLLISVGGNDTLDGGAGFDTARIEGSLADFQWSRSLSNVFTLSGDRTLTLNDFDRIEFTDTTLTLDRSEEAAQVFRLFQAALGRDPAATGATFWTEYLKGPGNIFDLSGFFEVVAPGDTQAYVTQLFETTLSRAPKAEGLAFWSNLIDTGVIDRGEALIYFTESDEAIERYSYATDYGIYLIEA